VDRVVFEELHPMEYQDNEDIDESANADFL